MELMDLIYQHLDMYFVDDPQPGQLAKVGIDAMLRQLDPYTVYYHENNIEDYRLMTTGQYGGIGALIRKIDNHCEIVEPYEGNPAFNAGLRAGDKILSIDGKDMVGKASADVSAALKGPKGSEIVIKVETNGKTKDFKVVRDEIKLPVVPYSGMLNESVGYIKLNSFMPPTTSAEVKSAFKELKSKGAKELVLDLRGNGGGLLIEAVKIVNMFVERGQLVVTTKGRVAEENRVYKTMEAPMDLDIPLVVLVDENSASASEIVAGSLQDLDRAVIIGNTSFGKGLVQRTYDLKYGSKIKLTIAKYYTPSGRCVQRLEYYDQIEGNPAEIPDSLIKKFKTSNGREVIDGRGIEPDVPVEIGDLSRLSATIYGNNLIYNYANQFVREHESIASPKTFNISEKDYQAFVDYVKNSDFTYSTASEEALKKWKAVAEAEGYMSQSEEDFNRLMAKVTPSKERDLEIFKDEIKEMLENEIVSRYYFQNGRAEYSFRQDPAIIKSLEIFGDLEKYKGILN